MTGEKDCKVRHLSGAYITVWFVASSALFRVCRRLDRLQSAIMRTSEDLDYKHYLRYEKCGDGVHFLHNISERAKMHDQTN